MLDGWMVSRVAAGIDGLLSQMGLEVLLARGRKYRIVDFDQTLQFFFFFFFFFFFSHKHIRWRRHLRQGACKLQDGGGHGTKAQWHHLAAGNLLEGCV